MLNTLKEKIKGLPEEPGVYIFKDAGGRIIYIGKAKSLKKRVQSYFSRQLDTKTQAMVSKISGLDYLLSPSEAQAQITEAALIKERQPQYNIDLKDDKSFPWIRISAEEFPVVSVCRRKKRRQAEPALYFGPYANAKLLRQALKIIRRIFGFRSCRRMPPKACLYYKLKLCPAPCVGKISRDDYAELIGRIKMFLESKYAELARELSETMRSAAAAKDFERAAEIRDQINALGCVASADGLLADVGGAEELKSLLKMEKPPLRIEAFDISNISGEEACGSMVSFYKGAPDKDNYRRFRIKTVNGIDDYAMLAEVVRRRYSRVVRENASLPDLILIDGGKSHLLTAARILDELSLNLPLISIAKQRENIYIKGKPGPIKLLRECAALNLIRRIRDEAHRFAVSYHHVLRRKEVLGK